MSTVNNGVRQNNIKDQSIDTLSRNVYENIFKVNTVNKEKNDLEVSHYFYNTLNKVSIPVDINSDLIDTTVLSYDTAWTTLSYQIYGTIQLWWLIVLLNNPKYIFMAKGGIEYTIIKPEAVRNILTQINREL